ncbi:hypothetical protein [Embleya sp. NPDC059237]|uniref:hypothetical protein n=1 Tax=Embleya sp. NPDC059237 TaxID=3346784 RepID=UPI00367711F1
MTMLEWAPRAPCAGRWEEFAPVEGAWGNGEALLAQCTPLLSVCDECAFVVLCAEAVRPAGNWFDGVCAGAIWINGKAVESRQLALIDFPTTKARSCGTLDGRAGHQERGEVPCPSCLQVQRERKAVLKARREESARKEVIIEIDD